MGNPRTVDYFLLRPLFLCLFLLFMLCTLMKHCGHTKYINHICLISAPLDVVIESQCSLTLVHSLRFVHSWMVRLRNIFNARYKHLQKGKVFRPARERPGSSVNWDGWNSRVLSQSHLLQLCRHFLVMSKQVSSDMRGPKLLFLNYIVLTELP